MEFLHSFWYSLNISCRVKEETTKVICIQFGDLYFRVLPRFPWLIKNLPERNGVPTFVLIFVKYFLPSEGGNDQGYLHSIRWFIFPCTFAFRSSIYLTKWKRVYSHFVVILFSVNWRKPWWRGFLYFEREKSKYYESLCDSQLFVIVET